MVPAVRSPPTLDRAELPLDPGKVQIDSRGQLINGSTAK